MDVQMDKDSTKQNSQSQARILRARAEWRQANLIVFINGGAVDKIGGKTAWCTLMFFCGECLSF